jgi:glycosyltransferase involved in cell wall biosynthesis
MVAARIVKKLCFVATVDWQVRMFLLEHIRGMNSKYDITVAMNAPGVASLKSIGIDVPVLSVGIERPISILRDLKALIDLFRLFRTARFDIVHSISPKSGLLAMSAAFLAGIKTRVHVYTGQVWATESGVMRWLLRAMDKITATFATHLLVDSRSQMDFLIKERVVPEKKASVLAKGSVCGVNCERFAPDQSARSAIRAKLGISESDVIFLFLGRLKIDKGIPDLAKAFAKVSTGFLSAHMLIVGPDEENMRLKVMDICGTCIDKVHIVDSTKVPEHYIASADVLCLPSYREGFGQVIIEAAAAGIPAIGSRIYGITDAIEEGKTGLLYEVGNVDDLTDKIIRFIKNPSLREEMGKCARERALRDFSTEILVSAMLDYYELLMIKNENNTGNQ